MRGVRGISRNLPELLYIEDREKGYSLGFRHLDDWDRDADICLIARWQWKGPGQTRWVCLDVSNGNPETPHGKVYVWVFKSKKEAQAKYQRHKWDPEITTLRAPVRCRVMDRFHWTAMQNPSVDAQKAR